MTDLAELERKREQRRREALYRRELGVEQHIATGVTFVPVMIPTFQLCAIVEWDEHGPARWTFDVLPVVAWVTDLLDESSGLHSDGTRAGFDLWPVALDVEGDAASFSYGADEYSARRVVVGRAPNADDELAVLREAWVHEWGAAWRAGVRWVVDGGEADRDSSVALERAGSWSAPSSAAQLLDRLDLLRAEITRREAAGRSSAAAGGQPAGGRSG